MTKGMWAALQRFPAPAQEPAARPTWMRAGTINRLMSLGLLEEVSMGRWRRTPLGQEALIREWSPLHDAETQQ